MNIVVFEDTHPERYYPLTLTRPVWELRAGAFSLRERLERFAASRLGSGISSFFCREDIAPFMREKYPALLLNDDAVLGRQGSLLCVNAACYPGNGLSLLRPGQALFHGDVPLAAHFPGPQTFTGSSLPEALRESGLEKIDLAGKEQGEDPVEYAPFIWSLVGANSRWIARDFGFFSGKGRPAPETVTIIGPRGQLYTGEDVEIGPLAVIDTRKGPVIIEDGAVIKPFTFIEGPSYVGRGAQLYGAKVREGVSIGEDCRIGGEVEDSIFHARSNKYHDGFIGHAYIGEWVNLGAMTTNSDLKNNYREVKVHLPCGRACTRERKIGCFVGDFVKASIGTLMNTGASIGAGAMLVHSGALTPAHVPSFSWFVRGAVQQKEWLEEFLETTRYMMNRRGSSLGQRQEELLRLLYLRHRGEPRIA